MKKLSMFITAGLFVMAFAGAAYAWSGHGWSSNSLDPMGYASISIQAPSHAETAQIPPDITYLDSNGIWAVQSPVSVAREGMAAKTAPAGKFVCFDSTGRSCAVSD
ncbi:MAG: hypothetical protein ACYDFU_09445 [Nitrospirota bacterium]